MPARCRACQLPPETRKRLETDYINGINLSQISRTYGIPRDSVSYHVEHHLPDKLSVGARKKLEADGLDLLHRVDTLLGRMEEIYLRNNDGKRDRMALRALDSQRSVFELLCRMSDSMHKARLAELEIRKFERQTTNDIDLSMLTDKEKNLYFELTRKILGDENLIVDLGGLNDSTDYNCDTPIEGKRVVEEVPEDVSELEPEDVGALELEDPNSSKAPVTEIRIRRKKPQPPDITDAELNQPKSGEEPVRFKPLEKWDGKQDPKLKRIRREFARAVHEEVQEQETRANTPGSPFFPVGR